MSGKQLFCCSRECNFSQDICNKTQLQTRIMPTVYGLLFYILILLLLGKSTTVGVHEGFKQNPLYVLGSLFFYTIALIVVIFSVFARSRTDKWIDFIQKILINALMFSLGFLLASIFIG